jgi:signal transduction histidine kinase
LSYKEAEIEIENGKEISYAKELATLGELCIPIYIEKELAYIFVLPEKNSQAPYTTQEKKIIITLRPKIALSLQILEYNKSLRDEVERQTEQINEQKKELEASYKKLEALDHEKDVFMNMAAHELRTPLTIMRGYADMMCTGVSGELNPLQQKLSTNILKGGESLLSLVNDLLDLSRIDAGKMELHYEECDIRENTHDIFENFS